VLGLRPWGNTISKTESTGKPDVCEDVKQHQLSDVAGNGRPILGLIVSYEV
jgi:hypothetical protein